MGLLGALSVVVVMPVHDEDGLPGFLLEIDDCLRPLVRELGYVLVDDFSSTPLSETVAVLPERVRARVVVRRNEVNLGHGPSALRAYRAGLDLAPDLVLHVDGDGQFAGEEMPALLMAGHLDGAAIGQRRGRTDPWFRKLISSVARHLVGASPAVSDVNSPLRVYRPSELRRLLDSVAPEALVPHLHFARRHGALGIRPVGVDVTSLPRRGLVSTGTMWGPGAHRLPSRRLIAFCWRAVLELGGPALMRPGGQAPVRDLSPVARATRSESGTSAA